MSETESIKAGIAGCRICAARFAATETGHAPRPVTWFSQSAPIVIAGQAPGARVHASGVPFDDPSGDRLRDWLGVDRDTFYDRAKFSIVPMAFCFPGYRKGSDLPPPAVCARTWRADVFRRIDPPQLTLLIGGYAQKWHLNTKMPVTDVVRDWRAHGPNHLPLPHPSWRNSGWIKKNPWFDAEILPWLRARVRQLLD